MDKSTGKSSNAKYGESMKGKGCVSMLMQIRGIIGSIRLVIFNKYYISRDKNFSSCDIK